jgi:hypothetical protein
MTTLSQQELNAGVSRRAIDTMSRNGRKQHNSAVTPKPAGGGGAQTTSARAGTFTEISGTKSWTIVYTPMRSVEILEDVHSGQFYIRETRYEGARVGVSLVTFKPYELAALRDTLSKIEVVNG